MFCKSCGSELQVDWKVCPKCGTLIDSQPIQTPDVKTTSSNNSLGIGKIVTVIGFIIFGIYILSPSQSSSVPANTSTSFLAPTKPSDYIQVVPGWTWTVDRYGYSKINGSIKNIGTKTISYFAVTAEYLSDDGKVLDTSYTNSLEKIQPGNEKRFEIMHKHSPDFKKSRIFPSQVRTE